MILNDLLNESLGMTKATTMVLDPQKKGFEDLQDRVFAIKNETPTVAAMLEILGVPEDGSPIRIRTGFMKYDKGSKMLYIAKYKGDLPQGT